MKKDESFPLNTFSERIDVILHMMDIKKVQFYSDLNLSRQTVTQWKKGSIPAADKLLMISEYLDVHPQWLLSGKIPQRRVYGLATSTAIVNRIYQTLETKFKCHHSDPDFLAPLQNCVTEVQLSKWTLGMQIPTIEQLKELSEKLKISLIYLVNGTEVSEEQSKKESTVIQMYYSLNEENQKSVEKVISAFYAKELYDKEHQ